MQIFFGIGLIILSIVSTVICRKKTPTNLRGFYGVKFWIIASIGITGGVLLVIYGLFPSVRGLL